MSNMPWVKTESKTVTRMVCCCSTHVGFPWLLQGLIRLLDHNLLDRDRVLQLVMWNPANTGCVEGTCKECCSLPLELQPTTRTKVVMYTVFVDQEYVSSKGLAKSLDWLADVVRKAHHEVTCQASQTATLAPMVIQR